MRRVGREQRVTLRLSRQRPGRVRQRERADEPAREDKPRQWRDLTVLASLLAVLLTVPGTVWAVLVAQDQLNQSEEAAVKEERAQASRVSAWTNQDSHGKWLIHVMNRSPDPIAQVYLSFEPLTIDTEEGAAWNVLVMSVPPCTDMVISQGQLEYRDNSRPYADLEEFRMPQVPFREEGWTELKQVKRFMMLGPVGFTDRNGVAWMRQEGRLSRRSGGMPVRHGNQGLVFGQPAYRTIEECGEGT
ncbi:hypothetical protein QBB31_14350 [Streptomyces scabiei]|uniref:hypothetical protein n=1 Tax=Streptomyces scabiei TaxID=1930 RepID=UPI002FF20BAC